ncbi:MAG: CehA/McbA family metallohydrolase [Alphaproteobacteria bacterium]|nr:CehA/McbA family metallohydrolase [Alphaproteobacteria bacterium]
MPARRGPRLPPLGVAVLAAACAGTATPPVLAEDTQPQHHSGWSPAPPRDDATPPVPCDAPADAEIELTSPAEGTVVRGAATPVLVRVTADEDGAEAVLCLDSEVVPTALPVIRSRARQVGDGWDLIAWLPLAELTAPGDHALDLRVRRTDGTVLAAHRDLTWTPRPHRVEVEVVDGAGRPVSARLRALKAGTPAMLGPPDGTLVDPYGRDAPSTTLVATGGHGTLFVDPGTWRLVASRSVRDGLASVVVTVPVDGPVRLVVPEVVPTPGRLSADLHVHTARSQDAFLPHAERLGSLLAAGVDVAVITDHSTVTDLDAALVGLAGPTRGGTRLIPGIELDVHASGPQDYTGWDFAHYNAYPVAPETVAPFPPGDPPTFGSFYDAVRARQAEAPVAGTGEAMLLQLNHPRGIHFRPELKPSAGSWNIFNRFDFDPAVPLGQGSNWWLNSPDPTSGTIPLDLDVLEVVNRFSLELWLAVRRDWFAFWNQGYRLTGTGNSDSHAVQVEQAGFPTNLVRAPRPDDDDPLDTLAFLEAVRGGNVLVSTGPVVELWLTGADGLPVEPGGMVQGHAVQARVRVRAAPWVPVPELRLVVDGEVVHTEALEAPPAGTVLDVERVLPLTLDADAWVLAEAGWAVTPHTGPQPAVGGDYAVVAPGYVPLGFTNPVRVDADGDGGWTPPGLF